jgi:hypothetical protein
MFLRKPTVDGTSLPGRAAAQTARGSATIRGKGRGSDRFLEILGSAERDLLAGLDLDGCLSPGRSDGSRHPWDQCTCGVLTQMMRATVGPVLRYPLVRCALKKNESPAFI